MHAPSLGSALLELHQDAGAVLWMKEDDGQVVRADDGCLCEGADAVRLNRFDGFVEVVDLSSHRHGWCILVMYIVRPLYTHSHTHTHTYTHTRTLTITTSTTCPPLFNDQRTSMQIWCNPPTGALRRKPSMGLAGPNGAKSSSFVSPSSIKTVVTPCDGRSYDVELRGSCAAVPRVAGHTRFSDTLSLP